LNVGEGRERVGPVIASQSLAKNILIRSDISGYAHDIKSEESQFVRTTSLSVN